MCASCFTALDALGITSGGAVVVASSGVRYWRERLRGGVTAGDRRAALHRDHASFVEGLGLDPDAVLGPPPQGALQRHG